MKKLCVFIITTVAMVLIANAALSETNSEIKRKIISEWIDSADYIATISHNGHAAEIVEFAKNKRVDVPFNGFLRRDSDGDIRFGIVVFSPGDKFPEGDFGVYLRSAARDNAACSFSPYYRVITLGSDNIAISRTFKGIILLHELNHTWGWFYNHHYNSNIDEEFVHEEVRVHSFQNDIMEEIGGPNYDRFVEKEALRLIAWQRHMIEKGGEIPELRLEYTLDPFFGKPLSSYEAGIRNFSVAVAIIFKVVELTEKDTTKWDIKKESALYWKYKRLGMLPSQNL